MSRTNLRERIKEGLFLLDGAMGTQLFARGIEVGTCNDYLNIDSPSIILNSHFLYKGRKRCGYHQHVWCQLVCFNQALS